ncbi:hypothetical protein K1719_038700 [Acacia pycnantha]|nr:hypothetical protein K1719_038700 [Acacia pycnantha]
MFAMTARLLVHLARCRCLTGPHHPQSSSGVRDLALQKKYYSLPFKTCLPISIHAFCTKYLRGPNFNYLTRWHFGVPIAI